MSATESSMTPSVAHIDLDADDAPKPMDTDEQIVTLIRENERLAGELHQAHRAIIEIRLAWADHAEAGLIAAQRPQSGQTAC